MAKWPELLLLAAPAPATPARLSVMTRQRRAGGKPSAGTPGNLTPNSLAAGRVPVPPHVASCSRGPSRVHIARPPGAPRMPPQQLNDDEMSVLMSLAGPIEHQRRPQFLQEVAQELEAKRQAGEVGKGSVHRVAPTISANILIRRNCPTLRRRTAAAPPEGKWPGRLLAASRPNLPRLSSDRLPTPARSDELAPGRLVTTREAPAVGRSDTGGACGSPYRGRDMTTLFLKNGGFSRRRFQAGTHRRGRADRLDD